MGRFYGRGRVIAFVEAALKCDVRDRPLPILLLAGPRGSGGSVLLDCLWEKFNGDCPCVRLDMAGAEEIADVMLTAMAGLRRHIWGVRQLDFPLLRLALKALSFADDGRGQVAFDAYMRAGNRAAAAGSQLEDWAERALPLLISPDQVIVAKLVMQLLGWALAGINNHQRDRASLRWFAEKSDVAGGSGFDPLWRLYDWHLGKDRDRLYKVDKTLCAAFLADMRTHYHPGIPHSTPTRNPALFLDNADSTVARDLLALLERCRRDTGDKEPADPLLVVAVQRRLPAPREDAPMIGSGQDDLDFTEWRRKATKAEHPTLWCPVSLSALDGKDVAAMTPSRVLGISYRIDRDADFVRALTGGHPEATDRLAAILRRLDPLDGPQSMLDLRIPLVLRDKWQAGEADVTVGDYLLRRAFADDLRTLPDGSIDADNNELLDAMAVAAAAQGCRLGACQAALNYLQWSAVTAVGACDRLTETMWLAGPSDGEPRLHPLAALLLRYWLARDPTKWSGAHEGYVVHYSAPRDAALRHRHKLALVMSEACRTDQLTEVVGFLDQKWESGPGRVEGPGRSATEDWLNHLDTVVAAANRLRATHHPEVFVKAIAGPEEPGNRRQVIARLTVARWLYNDRLFDPGHRLARLVADEYRHLAQLPGGDADLLLEEEARYRKIQHEWED